MSSALLRCSCLAGSRQAQLPLRRSGIASRCAAVRPALRSVQLRAAAAEPVSEPVQMQIVDGQFVDSRWKDGTWDLEQFVDKEGKTDWDGVIDAEMERRSMLEKSPIASTVDQVKFDTGMIPWYVWVRRFHLPEAEKLNGRAAMLGYVLALGVDKLTGAGLIDQQESFLGKLALHVTVFAVLLLRSNSDVSKLKNLFDEATFYDQQWAATWVGKVRPSERNNS